MVEVFKTNVRQPKHASKLLAVLTQQFPRYNINFDLEDCDKILRVKGDNILPEKIIEIITTKGYYCEILA